MKIVIKGKTEEECINKFYSKFNITKEQIKENKERFLKLTGEKLTSIYGHYGLRFFQELHAEFRNNTWKLYVYVGKLRKRK